MSLIRRNPNEKKWYTIWQLNSLANPNYYEDLFKYSKAFFMGMDRRDLVKKLEHKIWYHVERKMGVPIHYVLMAYKNLPHSNAWTRSKNPEYSDKRIYKHTLQTWLKKIEDWIFDKLVELEDDIRFQETEQMV